MENEQQHNESRTWADWFRQVAGAVVVAAIIGAFTLGGSAWISIIRHDDRLVILEEQAKEGKRFTKKDGDYHNIRITSLEASDKEQEERLDNHAEVQEHEGANRRLSSLEIRINELVEDWGITEKRIYDHTTGTSGRINRLENLERRVSELERKIK